MGQDGMSMELRATVAMGDQRLPYVKVEVTRPGKSSVEIVIHESLVVNGRLNVEIDGDFTVEDDPEDELTIHVNDRTVPVFK